mmetsp:Transcript_1013/g.1406  ORF Transcript_1013/g.1406 Transcript_1013/m.1406 type:complete len:142 (-) Transcript_1013:199-624(-)
MPRACIDTINMNSIIPKRQRDGGVFGSKVGTKYNTAVSLDEHRGSFKLFHGCISGATMLIAERSINVSEVNFNPISSDTRNTTFGSIASVGSMSELKGYIKRRINSKSEDDQVWPSVAGQESSRSTSPYIYSSIYRTLGFV